MEPIEYKRGFTNFLGCKIDLSKRPLIPRPETEFWVGKIINEIIKIYYNFRTCEKRGISVLDMFAGSGCVGIAVLKHIKNSKVVFADIENRMVGHKVVKSDVFSNVRGKFDLIFANPPYVAENKINLVQESVLKYEPRNALFGGEDGMFYINKFLKEGKKHLNKNGRIFMEFSPEQKPKIEKLLKLYKYKNWEFHKDQFHRYRWLVAS